MRALFWLPLLVAFSSLAFGQKREGIYRPEGSPPEAWRINEHHTLVWNNIPYMPFGIRSSGTPGELTAAKAAGITDAILELPASGAGWTSAIAAAEANGFRYLIAINSLAPMARGYAVEPQGYRVANITKKQHIEVTIPGATRALVLLITRRDSAIEKTSRVDLKNGVLSMDVDPANDLEHTLLIYPETISLQQTDYWEAFDEHRDMLLKSIKQAKLGPGFRGFVNPLGSVMSLATTKPLFVPNSPFFLIEYRTYLENKYKNVETLHRSWSLRASDLTTFEELARLVPMWSGTRGVAMLWDPKTDKLYNCEKGRSSAWNDINTVIAGAAAKRYQRLTRAMGLIVDVPVVQEWSGWAAPYETSSPPVDGLGMRISGTTPSVVANEGARAVSSVLRWLDRGWLIASDIDFTDKESLPHLANVTDDLTSLGARGWFFRTNTEGLQALGQEAQKRVSDTTASTWSPRPLFFPENAMSPALPQRLAGGHWWLPSPASGNRIDLGSRFFGYRYRDGNTSFTAIWTMGSPVRVKLRLLNPKGVTFTATDGSNPDPKLAKNGVEVTLTEYPLIGPEHEEIPIPEPALLETVARFDQLMKVAEAEQRSATEENFFFKDAASGFDRNPGGSFTIMRTQLWKLNSKVGRFTWVEAESSREHTFSELVPQSGASNGNVLLLRTSLTGPTFSQYSAELNVPVRTEEELEVWIAARIPSDMRENVKVVIGGQVLSIEGEPVSRYGPDFGWYRLGVTSLKGSTKARIEVTAPNGADLAIDALLLTPNKFNPSGVTPPDAITFAIGK